MIDNSSLDVHIDRYQRISENTCSEFDRLSELLFRAAGSAFQISIVYSPNKWTVVFQQENHEGPQIANGSTFHEAWHLIKSTDAL